MVDLRTGEPQRALRGGHASICAAVAFRPHRPWELLSGGLEGALVRWDFSTGRPRRTWHMADDFGESTQVADIRGFIRKLSQMACRRSPCARHQQSVIWQ